MECTEYTETGKPLCGCAAASLRRYSRLFATASPPLPQSLPYCFPTAAPIASPSRRLTFFLAYKKIPTCPVPDISQVTG